MTFYIKVQNLYCVLWETYLGDISIHIFIQDLALGGFIGVRIDILHISCCPSLDISWNPSVIFCVARCVKSNEGYSPLKIREKHSWKMPSSVSSICICIFSYCKLRLNFQSKCTESGKNCESSHFFSVFFLHFICIIKR